MECFQELKELLSEDISACEDRYFWLMEQLSKKEELERIIDVIDKNIELFPSQIMDVINVFPNLNAYFVDLEMINNILSLIHNNEFDKISQEKVISFLQKMDFSSDEIDKIIYNLKVCQNMYIRENNDSFVQKMVKEAREKMFECFDSLFQTLFSELIKRIKVGYTSYQNGDSYQKESVELKKYIDQLKKIDVKFSNSGLVEDFESSSELEMFYDWLIKRMLMTHQQEILKEIALFHLKMKEHHLENEEEVTLVKKAKDKKSEDINEAIFHKIKIIYEEIKKVVSERINFTDLEFGNNRRDNYLFQGKVEWGIILADLENNLFPNIEKDKERVFSIFQIIIDIYEQEKKDRLKWESILHQIEGYINTLTPLLKYAKGYSHQYDYLIETGQDFSDINSELSFEYVDLCYFLTHDCQKFVDELNKYMEIVKKKYQEHYLLVNEEATLLDISERFRGLLQKYQEKMDNYQKIDALPEEISFEHCKNLIFCFQELDFTDEYGRDDSRKRKEFIGSVRKIAQNRFSNNNINKVRENNGTKRQADKVIEGKYFRVFRLRHSDDYRTGIIHFKVVNPIIKKKLQEHYNLDSDCAFLAAFDVIKVSAGHDEYSGLSNFVDKNREQLETLGKMFAEPDTDMDKLYRIIDGGIMIRDHDMDLGNEEKGDSK